MLGIIDRLQATNRNLLNRLRPMALGDIPLTELLSELARERAREHTGMHIRFVPGPAEATYGEPVDPAGETRWTQTLGQVREVLNGIFYVRWTGCQWKALPKDLPPKSVG